MTRDVRPGEQRNDRTGLHFKGTALKKREVGMTLAAVSAGKGERLESEDQRKNLAITQASDEGAQPGDGGRQWKPEVASLPMY